MSPPKGLGSPGRSLWTAVTKTLPSGWELTEYECSILALAARQADDIGKLESALKRDGLMIRGSAGQPVLHPAAVEARQGRLAISRLLGQLELPDADQEPRTAAGKRGRRAAQARWGHVADLKARHG